MRVPSLHLLGAVLIRAASTVQLAGLEQQLTVELDLRARCAAAGHPSPHQLPPGSVLLTVLAAIAVLLFLRNCR